VKAGFKLIELQCDLLQHPRFRLTVQAHKRKRNMFKEKNTENKKKRRERETTKHREWGWLPSHFSPMVSVRSQVGDLDAL
jgi:hypothetical protein